MMDGSWNRQLKECATIPAYQTLSIYKACGESLIV